MAPASPDPTQPLPLAFVYEQMHARANDSRPQLPLLSGLGQNAAMQVRMGQSPGGGR